MRAALPPEIVVRTAPEEQQKHSSQQENRQSSGYLNHSAYDEAVFSGRRVVMKAVQKHCVSNSSDLVVGGLNQRKPQVFRREGHAVVILRQLATWSQHHDGSCIGERAGLSAEPILETNGGV